MTDVVKENQESVSNIESALNIWEDSEKDAGLSDEDIANVAYPETDTNRAEPVSVEGDKEEAIDEKPKVETEQTEQKEGESKAEYYARLTKLDRENRSLKKQVKDLSQNDLNELAKSDPMAVLDKLGISFNDLLDKWADNSDDNKEESANNETSNREIAELKQQIEELRQHTQQTKQQDAVNREYGKLNEMIKADEDNNWELIKHNGEKGLKLVLDSALAYYEESGEIPEYKEIMDAVEHNYQESYTQEIERIKQLNKFKGLFGKEEEALTVAPQAQPMPQHTASSPTLGDSPQSTPTPRDETARERYMNALKILNDAPENEGV